MRDNPYSEAAFKTRKYCPAFPERFGCIADARAFCQQFFDYYNHEHRHSGIGLHTPASVHYGTATEIRAKRAVTLDAAYAATWPGSATAAHRRRSCRRWRGSTSRRSKVTHRRTADESSQIP